MARNERHGAQGRASGQFRDLYQEATDKIVAVLEAGVKPWSRGWDKALCGGPVNAATGKAYRGINVLMLSIGQMVHGSEDPRWCSYRQAVQRGWQVKRGSRGSTVFFYKQIERRHPDAMDDADSANVQRRRIPLLRASTVFHASQIEAIPVYAAPGADAVPRARPEAVEIIARNSGADIRIGGDRAYFSPGGGGGHIQMPPAHAFKNSIREASVLVHELSHWSGTSARLNRDLTGSFGSPSYSREEARAELATVMIGAVLGLPADIPNHASYIEGWIGVLKGDRREVFHAAADAQKIADYLLAFHPAYPAQLTSTSETSPDESADDDGSLAEAA